MEKTIADKEKFIQAELERLKQGLAENLLPHF